MSPSVILAEGDDPRVIAAAAALAVDGAIRPVLVSHEPRHIHGEHVDIEVVTTQADAIDVAMQLVADGAADACVAGATRPTRDVIRSAIRSVGTEPAFDLVSSSFFFVLSDDRTMAFGDCGVIPDPTPDQLAAIAIETAATYRQLAGAEPRVAMLSFSTHGSANHSAVAKVRAATDLVRRRAPELAVDGELQFDAAIVPEVAAVKAPASSVAGRANVCIFPNLDAGNIGYKIMERMAGAQAFGPLLQGLARPVHDLSRGCSIDDIVAVATIAGYQATQSSPAPS